MLKIIYSRKQDEKGRRTLPYISLFFLLFVFSFSISPINKNIPEFGFLMFCLSYGWNILMTCFLDDHNNQPLPLYHGLFSLSCSLLQAQKRKEPIKDQTIAQPVIKNHIETSSFSSLVLRFITNQKKLMHYFPQ